MFSEHGRIDVAPALVHSDVNTNISTYVNFLVALTSETKEETTSSLFLIFSLSLLNFLILHEKYLHVHEFHKISKN